MVLDITPVPISASFNAGPRLVTVNFDKPLAPGPLNPTNWLLHDTLQEYVPTAPPTAAGSAVTWTASMFGAPTPPGNVVTYAATPADLTGLLGAPVAAFAQPWI